METLSTSALRDGYRGQNEHSSCGNQDGDEMPEN